MPSANQLLCLRMEGPALTQGEVLPVSALKVGKVKRVDRRPEYLPTICFCPLLFLLTHESMP